MILITGGGGFIGLNLARELVDRGRDVLLIRRHDFEVPSFLSPYIGKQVTIAKGDIGELPVLYSTIKTYGVESIVHAAVITETSPGSTLNQAIRFNLQGTADILEAARIFSLRRVTFLSSISVYMPYEGHREALCEDDALPATATEWIGGSKKAGEQICQLYARDYSLSVPIVRPPQVWGPLYWTGRSPVMRMVENAIAGTPAELDTVYGSQKSSYIYVRDCARAISLVHLAPSLKHAVYNISDGKSYSFNDFARAIQEAVPGTQIRLGEKPPEGYVEPPPMSNDRITSELGFAPDYDLAGAVRAYIAWLTNGSYI